MTWRSVSPGFASRGVLNRSFLINHYLLLDLLDCDLLLQLIIDCRDLDGDDGVENQPGTLLLLERSPQVHSRGHVELPGSLRRGHGCAGLALVRGRLIEKRVVSLKLHYFTYGSKSLNGVLGFWGDRKSVV